MSNITKKDIDHIARLARIKLTEIEIKNMTKDLDSILTYVDTLNQLATDNVEPMAHVTGAKNIMRSDDSIRSRESGEYTEKLLMQAPDRKEQHVKVKGVLR